MFAPAHIPELGIKRIKHNIRHRPRRGRNYAEFGAASDEPLDSPAKSSMIAVIDPKPLTRESILKMLATSLPEHIKLGVSSFEELQLEEVSELADGNGDLNLVILYIRSAGVANNWVQEQLQLIKAQRPEMPVIMISDRDDADDVKHALNCGVRGYIPTSIAAEVAIAALTLVEAGGIYIPVGALLPEGRRAQEIPEKGEEEQAQLAEELNLTSREFAVIDLLREGNANKVIAKRLNMRESTVKVHVRNILKKLRATNRTQAATVANRLLAKPDSLGASERPH